MIMTPAHYPPMPVRGFGPGLPPEGADLAACPGTVLNIDGWTGAEAVRREELILQRQGGLFMLQWHSPEGLCAITFEKVCAEAWHDWLAGLQHEKHPADVATAFWFWAAILFVVAGLLLLLILLFAGGDSPFSPAVSV